MIIVKGVYTPADCESCPFESVLLCEPNYGGAIPPGCPLVEVTPHGRLIDAEEERAPHE